MIFHKYIFEYYTKFNFKFLDVRGYIGLFFHCIETDRDRGLRYREGQRERALSVGRPGRPSNALEGTFAGIVPASFPSSEALKLAFCSQSAICSGNCNCIPFPIPRCSRLVRV